MEYYVHYMHGLSGIAEKLNIELRKFNEKLFPLYVQNIWICRKIENIELRKFNRKLSTLKYTKNCLDYMYGLFGFAKNRISRIA